jgi:hypothetical protein
MKNEEKKHENSELKLSLSKTEEIIGRLKEALNVKSDGQLANNLGISRQNIGAARKRDDVPPGWIYKVAELSGCSMDWLHFGDELQIDEDIPGFGAAVEMLARIYSSEDQLLIGTINANIRAFCEAIDRKQRDQHSTAELANLKNRLTMIEKQIKRDKPA